MVEDTLPEGVLSLPSHRYIRLVSELLGYTTVWKTWQVVQNLKFLPNERKGQWILCSFGRTWGSEISTKFSMLDYTLTLLGRTKY